MNNNLFRKYEISGVVVTTLITLFLWSFYELSDKSVVAIIFSPVNNSLWEKSKSIIISYSFYALVELAATKPYFKQFVVAKFFGVYILFLFYSCLFSLTEPVTSFALNISMLLLTLSVSFIFSYYITISKISVKNLFYTACFMLLLMAVMIATFTVFPPEGKIFKDVNLGLYGIIPDDIDVGAIVMDKIYSN